MTIEPVTAERWADLEALFGPRGAYAGCWCMFWRVRRSDFSRRTGDDNRRDLKTLAASERAPGLLAYVDGQVAAWCSVGPREDFAALERSRTLKRVDDQPVWSIVCFFVAKPFRRMGLMTALIRAAVDYARLHGASIVEGYPTDMDAAARRDRTLGGSAGYMGLASAYRAAGFVEVARASPTQLIMRHACGPPRARRPG